MNEIKVLTALCSLMFFMIGLDKFFYFLEPACSLMESIPSGVWYALGVMQLAAGILIWVPRFKKHVAGFFMVFMFFFIIVHLIQGTYDVGGAIFMAVLLGLLVWNPSFLRGKEG